MSDERLMKTPAQFVLSRLSLPSYEDFLTAARDRGFAFVRFRDFLPGGPPLPSRYIALRHDIDFAPEYSVVMAELEHAQGVASTYFVLADDHFYGALRPEVIRQLRRIRDLGHEIGLHFAVSNAVEADLGAEVAFRMRVLEAIAGTPVRSFCQHDPVNAGFASVVLPPGHPPCVDVTTVIREHDLLYVSESAMMWRKHTFHSALEEGRNLCLLAHPHSWVHPENDYVAMIRDLEARQVQAVTQRFDGFVEALSRYYARRQSEEI